MFAAQNFANGVPKISRLRSYPLNLDRVMPVREFKLQRNIIRYF